MKLSTTILAASAAIFGYATAFDLSCNSNYVSYYGQNSARNQKTLGEYCADSTEDVIVLAFMNGFPNVILNFANACETTFEGSTLLHCPNIAKDIKLCQSKGKAVVLSMGGAAGSYGFSSDSEATKFADTVWNMFFKGKAEQRPFDDAVLDGIDLDIEGGSGTGYPAFINQLRSHYASDPGRKYYIAAAPQCPYPDSYLGSTLNSAWFDMVYVQFYNNYCGLNTYPGWFNYEDWDTWAKTKSVNKDVKVYIGAPGSPSAASSGFVDGSTLQKIYNDIRSKYSSLGGVMTWDVSQARTSGIANTIRSFLDAGGSCGHNGGGESSTNEPTEEPSSTYSTSDTSKSDTSKEPSTSEEPSSTEPTTNPTNCPVYGKPCTGNQQGCNGSNYAICNNGSWYVVPCSSGTACYMNGNSASCDWANGRPTDGCAISSAKSISKRQDLTRVREITKARLFPKPARAIGNHPARVEFVAGEIVDKKYSTVIKIQTIERAFSSNWSFSFKLPEGQTIDSTSRGDVSVKDGVATIKSKSGAEPSKNMAAIFKFTGTFTGEYNLPDTKSAKFTTN